MKDTLVPFPPSGNTPTDSGDGRGRFDRDRAWRLADDLNIALCDVRRAQQCLSLLGDGLANEPEHAEIGGAMKILAKTLDRDLERAEDSADKLQASLATRMRRAEDEDVEQ